MTSRRVAICKKPNEVQSHKRLLALNLTNCCLEFKNFHRHHCCPVLWVRWRKRRQTKNRQYFRRLRAGEDGVLLFSCLWSSATEVSIPTLQLNRVSAPIIEVFTSCIYLYINIYIKVYIHMYIWILLLFGIFFFIIISRTLLCSSKSVYGHGARLLECFWNSN